MTTANRLLVAMGGISAVAGVLEPHAPLIGAVETAYTLAMATLLFFWCKADGAARGVPIPPAAPALVALIAIIGVPYYYFRILPSRQAAAATGRALLFFLLLIVLHGVCYFLSERPA